MPGHSPPQVTMAARASEGSNQIFWRGPAASKAGRCMPCFSLRSTSALSW